MILKFVLKNLLLVALIAFAINLVIKANINIFKHASAPHSTQLQELTQEELFQESEMLN